MIDVSQLGKSKFIAWMGIESGTPIRFIEDSLHTLVPFIEFSRNRSRDEVESWTFEGGDITIEVQLPETDEGLIVLMIAGSGQNPLDNAAELISQYISETSALRVQALSA